MLPNYEEEYPDDERSQFIISGGEVLELNHQHSGQPVDTHVSGNMPKWMQDYRRSLQAQEKAMTDEIRDDATTIVPTPEIYIDESLAVSGLYALRELEVAQGDIALRKQQLIDQVLTPEIKKAIEDINAEFFALECSVASRVESTKANVESEVLKLGHSVSNPFFTAQWKHGRAGGYDAAMLKGMAKIIPQINEAKKPDGDPTVAFVPVKSNS